ncbi:putative barnase/colicin E5 family endoribonuclease, partial [Helicobacter pylori]|uniref:putative barnase/colicin E5 family endoribonuclease n=1 Tax=Helicobacter pylori TaxID=210 RepID=UPI002016F182
DFTHYLLMANREPSENNTALNRLIQAVKDMQKEKEKVKTPSEWGNNYSEFKGDGLGAINKLLETKKGFVAGAFYKEGLGDIDLVWGNKDYGLEHILKRREKQAQNQGLNEQQAKEYALNIVKSIPEVIEKGKVGRDIQGRLKIETKDILIALRDNWQGERLKNRWVITGFEKKVGNIREQAKFIDPSLITKDGERLASSLNSLELDPNINALKTQEPKSALEQANAEKLAKLETEKGITERAFKVIEDKEAFFKDLNAIKPMQLPREIDTDSFLNAFNGVKNKENFIKHLKSKPDSKHRLAYLHLVEPTLKDPDITLIFKDQGKEVKKEHVKAFQGDPKTIYYFLVTQDNDSKLITGLRISENYLKAEIDKADIIHSFIPQDS